MIVSRLSSVYSRRLSTDDLDVGGLFELLSTHVTPAAKDEIGLWSPTTFAAGRRLAEEAVSVCAAVFDYDDGTTPLAAAFDAWAPWARVVHTSWSHEPDAPRFRLVLPFVEPVPAVYWPRVWAWLAAEAERRGVGGFDPTSKAIGRFYYLPAARPDGPPPAALVAAGGELLAPPDPRTLPEPLATARGFRPGELPAALDPVVARLAVSRWRALVAHHSETIAQTRKQRRLALQIAAYHLGGFVWLGAYSGDGTEALARELHSALWGAARRCGRATHDTERLLDDTIDAAAGAPLPVDSLVPVGEHAAAVGPEAAPDPLLVKYRSGHWIRMPEELGGYYVGPYDRAGILPVLREIGRLPTNARGKPEGYETILATSGVNAESVRVVYPQTHAGSEPAGWTWADRSLAITRAVYMPPDARRSNFAERYLCALVGPEALPTLLDWLAASHRHEAPAPALYLDGPPGTGKTLLSKVLAAPWGRPPVDIAAAIGNFSSDLATCPIVLVDEGYPLDVRGLAAFRSLVSERGHRLTEKYLPDLTLSGTIRVVVAANNGDALEIRDVKSTADLVALAERVLYLRIPDDSPARAVLEAYDGPDLVAELAAHVEYLRATRSLPAAGRWLVAAPRSAWHDSLLWRVPLHAAILGTILVGLARRGPARAPDDFRRDADGGVLVRVAALNGRWLRDCPDEYRRPSLAVLAAGLAALGVPAGPGAYVVPGPLLDGYGRAVGLTVLPPSPESP